MQSAERKPERPLPALAPAAGRAVLAVHALAAAGLAAALLLAPAAGAASVQALAGAVLALQALVLLVVFPAAAIRRRFARSAALLAEATAHLAAPLPVLALALAATGRPAVAALAALAVQAALALAVLALLRSRRLPEVGLLVALGLLAVLPASLAAAGALARGTSRLVPAALGPLGAAWAVLEAAAAQPRRPGAAAGAASTLAAPLSPPPGLRVRALRAPAAGAWRPGVPVRIWAEVEGEGGAHGGWLAAGAHPLYAAAAVPPEPLGVRELRWSAVGFSQPPALAGTEPDSEPAWRQLAPGERLELVLAPGPARLQSRPGAVRVVTPVVPGGLGELRAFDVLLGEPGRAGTLPVELMAAHRALVPWLAAERRPDGPALDPELYRVLRAPALAPALRVRWTLLAAAGAAAVAVALACGGRRRGVAAGVVAALLAAGAIAVLSPRGTLLAREHALLRLLPGEASGALERVFDLVAPFGETGVRAALPAAAGRLEGVLAEREPGTPPLLIVELADGSTRLEGLRLGSGARQLLRSHASRTLAGPLELVALPGGTRQLINRTGLEFARVVLLGPRGSAPLGPLADGASLELPAALPRAQRLDALPPELAPLVLYLARAAPVLERGLLVLAGPPPAPVLEGPEQLEAAPLLVLLPLRP
ncbi:MAG: hypothetical protein KatS3mg102_2462 [Planctomycetota bacterium]|nr:MAG: hypothetical protein KatS3mg102_2462 [Planctomycetota bacterium]